MHRSGMLKGGNIETRQEYIIRNRSHRTEGRSATINSEKHLLPLKTEHVDDRRNPNKFEDHMAKRLSGKHTDPSSGLALEDTWLTYKQSRTKLEDNIVLNCYFIPKNSNFSAQNNRHEGSGPIAATTYAGNVLDDSKWENVGIGDTERQICTDSRCTPTRRLPRTHERH
eukprot:4698057-Heterocapsa_arctica.AAC.1